MPCGIGFIQWLSEGGYLPAAGRVLDLGGSRLLGATPAEIRALLTAHGSSLTGPALDAACADLSARSEPNGDCRGIAGMFMLHSSSDRLQR